MDYTNNILSFSEKNLNYLLMQNLIKQYKNLIEYGQQKIQIGGAIRRAQHRSDRN
jgi:hypothetical protein